MSWRWVIDLRDGEPKVDRPWLVAAVLSALVFTAVVLAVLPSPADYIVCAVVVVAGLVVDVMLRRERPKR